MECFQQLSIIILGWISRWTRIIFILDPTSMFKNKYSSARFSRFSPRTLSCKINNFSLRVLFWNVIIRYRIESHLIFRRSLVSRSPSLAPFSHLFPFTSIVDTECQKTTRRIDRGETMIVTTVMISRKLERTKRWR